MSTEKEYFLTGIGRYVSGDIWKARTKDNQGNDKFIKTGANKGQPLLTFSIGVAFEKLTPQGIVNPDWTAFEAILKKTAHRDFPALHDANGNLINQNNFSYKITDGDSEVLNENNKRPCDHVGYKGHWIVFFVKYNEPPVIITQGGQAHISNPDLLKRGYYVRINGSCNGNETAAKPGIYINLNAVELIAPCKDEDVIVTGPDIKEVHSEQASYTPAGMTTAAAQPAQGQPATTETAAPAPAHDIVEGAVGGPPADEAVEPPPPSGPEMTDLAKTTYEGYVKSGWNEAQMRKAGFLV